MSGAAVATAESWLQEESELGAVVRDVAYRMAVAVGVMRGPREPLVREVRLPEASYRVRGSVLPQPAPGGGSIPAIVVTLERMDGLPSDEVLRRRFRLTRTEVRVARLLAEGMTNQELADALIVSPHTARHHTTSILGKLGLRSRRAVRERLMAAVLH